MHFLIKCITFDHSGTTFNDLGTTFDQYMKF